MLRIAKIKVPHGKLQFAELGPYFPMSCEVLELQGPLDPWRFGLVRIATAMKAPTNRMSKSMSMMRVILEALVRRISGRIVAMMVYRTAAARIPSTAPFE